MTASMPPEHSLGPAALGRGAVVQPGAAAPPGLESAPRIRIDDEILAAPREVADRLHRAWARREPVVVEFAVDNDALRAPQVCETPPHDLPASFGLDRERLYFLTWANNHDCRSGVPVWHLATHHATALGATPDGVRDVRLPDGTTAWVDGGPRGPVAGLDEPVLHRESLRLLRRLTVARGGAPAESLAPDQLAAVTHPSGPARILAPAGSGKTRVLTARLRHLLRDRGVEPELVTAVAYNTRAAEEMRARTGDLPANVRTIHSLAFHVCNQVDRRDVIHERDVRSILERLVRTGRVPNTDPYRPYLEALAEVRLGLRNPESVERERDDVDGFAQMFPRYRSELARRGVTDFDDQVYRAIELLLTQPELRAGVQRSCTHLLVDEFQDLTPAFLLLIRLVAGPALQVFGVGDDDQVIYGYAGATPDYLIDYDQLFPGADTYALEVNYRCPPAVVGQASTLLRHNRRRVAKSIRPADGRPFEAGAVEMACVDAAAMADRVAASIGAWLAGGVEPAEVAVLARVNAALLPTQVALTHAGIPHDAPIDTTILGRTGMRSAFAWLRLGLDPERIDRDDLFETLRRPSRKLVTKLKDPLRARRRWTLDGLRGLGDLVEGRARKRLEGYADDIVLLCEAITEGADTARCLELIRHDIGLDDAVTALDESRGKPEGSSHADDLDALEQLAALQPDPATFRDWLVANLRVPASPDGVTLSTVHRVKGMEWDRVVVVAANAGLFPHRLADDPEEERRIFHVALTRCREAVTVVANRDAPSPFIANLTAPPTPEELARPVQRQPRQGIASAPRSRRAAEEPLSAEQELRFEQLRTWRKERSRLDGLPAFVILHDSALREMARTVPTSLRELASVSGIGPAKLERYGDDLLEVLEDA